MVYKRIWSGSGLNKSHNYKITPPHIAFAEARKEADKLGVLVTGSELIGLIPKEAMLMAGRYFLEKQGSVLEYLKKN